MVLYNMASLLASFGSGFDIRMSNISPVVHPRLQNLEQIQPEVFNQNDSKFHNSPLYKNIYRRDRDTDLLNLENIHQLNTLYGMETYHGPTKQKLR